MRRFTLTYSETDLRDLREREVTVEGVVFANGRMAYMNLTRGNCGINGDGSSADEIARDIVPYRQYSEGTYHFAWLDPEEGDGA